MIDADKATLEHWLKEIVERFSLFLGVISAPLLERLTLDEMNELKKDVKKRTIEYYATKFNQMQITDRSMAGFGKMLYDHLIGPITVAGQREAVVDEKPGRLVTEAYECVELDVWKQITSKPELICELDAVFMAGMATAFNPNLIYTQYSGPEKDGQIQWGLPYGKDCCRFIMEDESKSSK